MFKKTTERLGDRLNIIWTIAAKDIVDALQSKVVVSLIVMLSIMLLVPKMLPYIFDQPRTVLPVYGAGASRLAANLQNAPTFSVQKLSSEQELTSALCAAAYPEIGLLIPADFDQVRARERNVWVQIVGE